MKIKKKLRGKRIHLQIMDASIENAEKKFLEVDRNRAHLQPWLEWVDETKELKIHCAICLLVKVKEKKGKK